MSTNGDTKAKRPPGLVDATGAPLPMPDTKLLDEISDEPQERAVVDLENGEKVVERTQTLDPRRMQTGLLLYNFFRSTLTEVSLSGQLEHVQQLKKKQSHVGDLPGESQVRQMLQNCIAHRTILSHTINDRFKDFDAAYWAREGVEGYLPTSGGPSDEDEEDESPAIN